MKPKTQAEKPARELGNAHAGPVAWVAWWDEAPTHTVTVKAQTWFEARRIAALRLGVVPSEVDGRQGRPRSSLSAPWAEAAATDSALRPEMGLTASRPAPRVRGTGQASRSDQVEEPALAASGAARPGRKDEGG